MSGRATTGRRLAVAAALAAGLGSAAAARATADSPCASPYVMEPGDTLSHVARQCAVTVEALRAANPDLVADHVLAVGTRLTIPGAQGGEAASLAGDASAAVPADSPAATLADPLPADAVAAATADMDAAAGGAADAEATVAPAAGDDAGEPGGAADAEPTAGAAAAGGEGTVIVREGRLGIGVECPILTATDGTVYSLTGEISPFDEGDEVRIRATRAQSSFCMENKETLDVQQIEHLGAPKT